MKVINSKKFLQKLTRKTSESQRFYSAGQRYRSSEMSNLLVNTSYCIAGRGRITVSSYAEIGVGT